MMRVFRALSWALPLAAGAVTLSLGLARPWTGSYDANGALFSAVARNTLRYGLAATGGGQVVNGGRLAPSEFRFYTHHPPGLPLTIAASFAVFGVHEWSARLVPILFSLGAAAALYLVARELAGAWAGFFAAWLFVVQPMVAFYGRMPDHEAPGAFFALALTALYQRAQQEARRFAAEAAPAGRPTSDRRSAAEAAPAGRPTSDRRSAAEAAPAGRATGSRPDAGRRWVAWMCVGAFIGVWYAWIVVLVPWVLLAHRALCNRRGAAALGWPALAGTVGFLTVVGHIALVGGLGELWTALCHRLGAQAVERGGEGSTFGFAEFFVRQYEYFVLAFSVSVLLPCAAWAVGVGRRARGDALLVLALATVGLFNVLGFKQGAYIHIYYQFYLAIPLALAGGMALEGMVRLGARFRWLAILAATFVAMAVGFEGWQKLGGIRDVVVPEYESQIAVARRIREATQPEDHVQVVWALGASFRQLTYYADRNISVVADESEGRRSAGGGNFSVRALVRDGGLAVERMRAPE